jgi:hypothetical protein
VHAGLITWIAHSIRSNFISRPLRQTWKGLSYSLPHTSQTATAHLVKKANAGSTERRQKLITGWLRAGISTAETTSQRTELARCRGIAPVTQDGQARDRTRRETLFTAA